jgi:hypothetical protein
MRSFFIIWRFPFPDVSMSTDAGASLFEHSWLSFLMQATPISLASDSAWHAFQLDRGRNFIKYS